MQSDRRKVAVIGCGFVGMSFAYAALNQGVCDELVLLDIDRRKAEGEAMDLNHGLAFSGGSLRIFAGDYPDTADADIAVLCCGVPQREGEDRLSLYGRNAAVFDSVCDSLADAGFSGIFLVASNPVDLMTYRILTHTGADPSRVIGAGTALDTARLRYLLGQYFAVDPRNVHAYVIGEHGESELIPWSQAMVGTQPVLSLCAEFPDRYRMADLEQIGQAVRGAAARIIAAKRATYYGIGMALVRIVRAIFGNEASILTVSTLLSGAYGQDGICAGIPCILDRAGIRRAMLPALTDKERAEFARSCAVLRGRLPADGGRVPARTE